MPVWAAALAGSVTTKLTVAAILLAAGVITGWELNDWRSAAKRERALEEAVKQMAADQEKVNAVAVAYEGITAELRRLQRLHVREVIRETSRVEYSCPLPDSGRVLIDTAIDQANATAGRPDAAVPAHREKPDR